MNAHERLERIRAGEFDAEFLQREVPAYVRSKGPSGIQTYLAVRGIQIGLPIIRRALARDRIDKAFRMPGVQVAPKAPKVLRKLPLTPRLPGGVPKVNVATDRINGIQRSPFLRSKFGG